VCKKERATSRNAAAMAAVLGLRDLREILVRMLV